MTIQDIIGKWDFDFWIEENKSTILTIFPDGEATTEVTYYKYEIIDDKIHLYIEDYVDYWGILVDGTLSGTAESLSNEWHWSAKLHITPIVKAIPQKRLFDSSWVIVNKTEELEDNKIVFCKDGIVKSDLYGIGSWKYLNEDLCIETANGFIQYRIKEIDGCLEANAINKVGQEWVIVPKITLIPKPIPKKTIISTFKDNPEIYIRCLEENNIKYLYHFTDRSNIPKIKSSGGLYSWHYLEEHNMSIPRAGGDEISRSLDKKYRLEDYVRLSFCSIHPMSMKLRKQGADIVYLKVALDPVILRDTLFSDMNATDNLHHHGGDISDLKKVRFECTQLNYAEGLDFKYKQAEVMVKTFIPIKYILNINNF